MAGKEGRQVEWTGALALAESGRYGDRDGGGIEVRVVLLYVEMDAFRAHSTAGIARDVNTLYNACSARLGLLPAEFGLVHPIRCW
ncbi:Os11g0512750 [Oryza sativa Japonica Group]|uniref:Os11g0512750 protein n=1 Tax=Oryza sativa subsp. japonica TaxID=39947 RepID=A0A0P0Y2Q8_ORYSJ|nr:Os11g0512750 [Oryza sativa Japonica Group]